MAVISDPIGDMLVRIKNAYRAKKASVVIPHSNLKEEIAKVLEARGYISGIEKKGKKARKYLEFSLKYSDGVPVLESARRISKPSRKMYAKASEIKPVRYGHGLLILSTPKGVMSGEEARRNRVGGEIIAEIW